MTRSERGGRGDRRFVAVASHPDAEARLFLFAERKFFRIVSDSLEAFDLRRRRPSAVRSRARISSGVRKML